MWKPEQSHRLERRRTEDGSDAGAVEPATGILAAEALQSLRSEELGFKDPHLKEPSLKEPSLKESGLRGPGLKDTSGRGSTSPPPDCGELVVVSRSEDLDATRLYLNEIGFSPLLTADEEKQFSRLALAGDESARQRMIESNLRLVVKIARRYINRGLPLLDLIEEGNIGLMHSVEKFDPELGYRFSTYATWWIRQTIERGIMNQTRTVRLPVHVAKTLNSFRRAARELEQHLNRQPSFDEIAERVKKPVEEVRKILGLMDRSTSIDEPMGIQGDLSLADCIEDEQQSGPAELLQDNDVLNALTGWLTELTDKQREVVTRRFGLEGGEKFTLEEVGAHIGVTRERVRQIQIEALGCLRRMIDRDGLSADTLFQ